MGDKLSPDEMKEAGLGHVTPAEAHGRDNGAGPRPPAEDLGEGPVHDPTNTEKLFPSVNDPGGRPANWTNNPSESGDLITQALQMQAFGRLAGAPFQAIAPVAEPAGAAKMASSAAFHAAGKAVPAAGSDILPILARLLLGHSKVAKVAHMAAEVLPRVGNSAAAGADAMMQGAASVPMAGLSAQNAPQPQDSAEQRMARILMQGINQPEMK